VATGDAERITAAAPTRIVLAVSESSTGTFTGRASAATAELVAQTAERVPSHPRWLVRQRPRRGRESAVALA
jgi:hypothetical protein